VHGVQSVGLVVVPTLVMAHVNRDRRVEGREEVLGGCKDGGAKEEEMRMGRGRGDFKKNKFQRQKGYNKAT